MNRPVRRNRWRANLVFIVVAAVAAYVMYRFRKATRETDAGDA